MRDALVGAEHIGRLTSFFKSVGGVVSVGYAGRFTLDETLNLWQASAERGGQNASSRLGKVKSFQALFESAASNPIVTIAEFIDGRVVVDGNHTAIAALLCARNQQGTDPFTLPVYILTIESSVAELG